MSERLLPSPWRGCVIVLSLVFLRCAPAPEGTSLETETLASALASTVMHPLVNTALCLEAGPASSSNGLQATIAQCTGAESQTWTYTGGALRVGDRCLDVNAGVDANGTKVQLWGCQSGNANQQWERRGNRWVWRGHDKCLHVEGSKGTAGTVGDARRIPSEDRRRSFFMAPAYAKCASGASVRRALCGDPLRARERC